MKGNIKRLALFVSIAVIVPFIMAGMASAAPLFPPALQGQYAVTGAGTTLLAPLGFDTKLMPKDAAQGNWMIQTFNSGGVYTFNLDGTGRAEMQIRAILFPFTAPNPNPPPPRVPVPPGAAASSLVFSFHYTIADDGKITITADPGTCVMTPPTGPSLHWDGIKMSGFISYDGKMIVANGGTPDIMSIVPPVGPFPPTLQLINNVSAVMTWRSW